MLRMDFAWYGEWDFLKAFSRILSFALARNLDTTVGSRKLEDGSGGN